MIEVLLLAVVAVLYAVVAGAVYQRLYPGPYVGEPEPKPAPAPTYAEGIDDVTAYHIARARRSMFVADHMSWQEEEEGRRDDWRSACRRAGWIAALWLPAGIGYGAWWAVSRPLRAAYRFGRRVA